MPVLWRAKALADVGRIVRYIAADNPVAAKRIGRELLLAGDSLVMFPRRGRPGRLAGTRELAVALPYIIVYRVAGAGRGGARGWLQRSKVSMMIMRPPQEGQGGR